MAVDVHAWAGFEELYASLGPQLWRAILAYTGGRRDMADDVVAESFVRTLERGSSVVDPRRYIFRVAFRLAAKELRRHPTTDRLPDSAVWDAPELVELFDVLRRLSPGQRAAVFLRYQGDLSIDEIAGLMGTSPGAVRIHLMRGRRALAKILRSDVDE